MNDEEGHRRALAGLRYEYVSAIGHGGFGTVLRVRHPTLDHDFALKILGEGAHDAEQSRERMRVEAQAMARLDNHPNMVGIHDYGATADGRPYLVMDLLEGRALDAEIKARGKLPVAEAVAVARQMLAALAAAHAIGIVHRDVKPANVFLVGDGAERRVKLLDFGIAKIVQGGGDVKPLAKGTAEGTILGSPHYLAPEQAQGTLHLIDPRTDLYAMGGVLYKMLTGLAPFESRDGDDTMLELLRKHALVPVESPSRRTGVALPPRLDALVVRALAKRREDRPPSADAFAAELDAIARTIAPLTALTPRGTEEMPRERMLQEVSRRQREVERARAAASPALAALPTSPAPSPVHAAASPVPVAPIHARPAPLAQPRPSRALGTALVAVAAVALAVLAFVVVWVLRGRP